MTIAGGSAGARGTALGEWKSMWPLAAAALLGVSGTTIFSFTSGVVMQDMTQQFGWSRAEFSSAYTFQMMLGLVLGPLLGRVVDRVGARRVALIGLLPFAISVALLSQANGTLWQWWALCLLVACTQAAISATVWLAGVVTRFEVSRGLAAAVTLSGLSVGLLIYPLIGAFVLRGFGWQYVFPVLALVWLVLTTPMALLFFHGAPRPQASPAAETAPKTRRFAKPSPVFVMLMIAGGLFSCGYTGIMMHLVSILRGKGIDVATAAAISGLAGLFSIIGRLTTGYLVDRFAIRPIGVMAFCLLIPASLLLGFGPVTTLSLSVAVAMVGLASGAELDLVTVITARLSGAASFGSHYAVLLAFISVSASGGPILAGWLFDRTGSYQTYLIAVPVMTAVGAALIASLPLGHSNRAHRALPDDGAQGAISR